MTVHYTEKITARGVIEPWVIRTYLHRRIYNVLIITSKAIGLYRLLELGFSLRLETLFSLILFFYFELYILYRYISVKKKILSLYGNRSEREITMTEDCIQFKDVNSKKELNPNEITNIKETKWFLVAYKVDQVFISHYKNLMEKETVEQIRNYYNQLPTVKSGETN